MVSKGPSRIISASGKYGEEKVQVKVPPGGAGINASNSAGERLFCEGCRPRHLKAEKEGASGGTRKCICLGSRCPKEWAGLQTVIPQCCRAVTGVGCPAGEAGVAAGGQGEQRESLQVRGGVH